MTISTSDENFVELAIRSTERLCLKLAGSLDTLKQGGPVTASDLADPAAARTGHADLVVKHFLDVFESGRRLFRAALVVWEEPQDSLSYIDLLNRAEKLGVLISAARWREIGKVRNRVVHEYAMEPQDAADAVTAVLPEAEKALMFLTHAVTLVRQQLDAQRSGL